MARQSYQWNHDFPKLAREAGFMFNPQKSKVCINWNDIKVVDIEQVIRDRDFITVDEHINEVLDCQLETEFDVRILDVGFVKLFRLAQLAVEYLLQCRRHLDIAIPALKADMKEMAEDADHLKRQLRSKEEEIRKLRSKTRKHNKAMGNFKNSDLTNLLKRISWNETSNLTPPPPPSIGEQVHAAFQKCQFCDKAFLNQFYLQSHLLRRHPNFADEEYETVRAGNAPTSSPDHGLYKIETDKLYLEIKELKERLNATEKRLHSNEFDKNGVKLDKKDDDKGEIIINVSQYIGDGDAKDDTRNEDDKAELDKMEKEMITVEMFEDWKKEEQAKFREQMEILKKQLADNLNLMQNAESRVVQVKEKLDDKEDGRIAEVTAMLKRQDEEVKSLQEKLQEKVSPDISQLMSRLESQETFWRTRLLDSEKENRQIIEQLKQNTAEHLKQAEEIQRQYKERIGQLEESVREQNKTLQEQAKQLTIVAEKSNTSQVITTPSVLIHQKSVQSPSRTDANDLRPKHMHKTESHETLPPYDEELIMKVPNPSSSVSSRTLRVIYQREGRKQELDESDTESSANGMQVQPPPKRKSTPEKEKHSKHSSGNTTVSSDSSFRQKKAKKPLSRGETVTINSNISTPKTVSIHTKSSKAKNIIPRPHSDVEIGAKKPAGNKNIASSSDTHIMKKKTPIKYDSSSTETSSASSHRPLVTTESPETKASNKSSERVTREQNVMKAVKSDLRLIVDKRLQQLGVQKKHRGITNDTLKKNLAAVHHRRHLVAKQHDGYNRLRKSIISSIEEKVHDKYKRSPGIAHRELSKSTVSLTKVGSILSSVKNKAINIIRSRDSLRFDKNMNEREAVDKRGSSANQEESYYEKFKRIASPSSRKFSMKETHHSDTAKSVMSVLAAMREQGKSNMTTNEETSNKAQETETVEGSSETESSETETSTSEEEETNAHTQGITVVTQSSIEKFSPIRRPGLKDDASIASSTPTRNVGPAAENFGNISDISDISVPKLFAVESKRDKIASVSKSEENLSMYAGATTDSSDSSNENEIDTRKAISVDNISSNATSQKSVLKNVLSTGSLAKKKVLFDLDANEMKSLSASPSVSGAIEVKAKAQWESRADANTDSDSEWDISNVDEDPPNHKATIHTEPSEVINLRTKQSPMIAELSKTIGAQISTRTEKPPTGGIDTIFQAKSAQSSPKRSDLDNIGGSTPNIASSAAFERKSTSASFGQPVPKPRTVVLEKKSKEDSDLELSDWSIEDLLNK